MVWIEGLEPSTSPPQTVRASQLRHIQINKKPPNLLAGIVGIEPTTLGLEANMLPLH